MGSSLIARSFGPPPLMTPGCPIVTSSGISGRFQPLSPSERQITHVLLTLAPLYGVAPIPFDLHASSTPSAFDLNQDQILNKITFCLYRGRLLRKRLTSQFLLFFYCQNILNSRAVLFLQPETLKNKNR